MKGFEIAIIARDFSRIFLQNGINLSLNMITCPEIDAEEGDEIELTAGKVINKTKGKEFTIVPLPPARQVIIDAGGLIAYTKKRLMGN